MKLKTNCAVFGSLLLTSVCASAATVSFSGQNYADGLISTTGTLVGALNGTTAETVNTVPFAEVHANAGTVNLADSVTVIHGGGTNQTDSTGGAPGALTYGGVYHNASADGSLIFNGLTSGQDYEIQMVFSAITAGATYMTIWGNGTGAGAADFTSDDIGVAPQLITGTFTADDEEQGFWLTQHAGGRGYSGYLGAFQLRAVPEPSSLALLALGGLTLIFKRRK